MLLMEIELDSYKIVNNNFKKITLKIVCIYIVTNHKVTFINRKLIFPAVYGAKK